ncbi:SPOR domain-containing protein [Pseudopedobacter beijingensis]|uniref:SPOR domain-containing protein n=1 Tax=Pseudopedobacter beijingensis TaxID=1207056 RepID=A0ABW4IGT7_9SPHI
MKTPLNLRALIDKNHRIILSGIGVFYKKRTEAIFDENRNSFSPPREDIGFSYNLSESNDDYGNLSTQEITYITELSADLKAQLRENGSADIANLGKLKRKGDVVVFEKLSDSEDFNNSFFGLPTLKIEKDSASVNHNTTASVTPEPVKNEESFSLAEQALSVATPQEDMDNEEPAKSKTWLYIFLIIVILALSGSALYLYRPDLVAKAIEQVNQLTSSKQIEEKQQPAVIDSLAKLKADSIYNEQINIEQELKDSGFEAERVKDSTSISIEPKPATNKPSIRYEIIISAWRTEAKALTELKRLRANGIDAHILDDGGLLVKISAASFYNKEEAEKELKRIQEEINSEAFIRPIKLLN